MDLKRKLSRLANAGPGGRAPSPRGAAPRLTPATTQLRDGSAKPEEVKRLARITRLRGLIDRMVSKGQHELLYRPPPRVEEPLPGEVEETPLGPLHRIRTYLEPEHHHGKVAIRDALGACPITLSRMALDEGLSEVVPERMLLLDTETTGLAGGTGTLPFLIGLAWFEDQSLHIEQMLLRRPGEEVPMLTRLAERLNWASVLVTYNGKSYDWPLLRTRFVLNRVRTELPCAHLDLLHCVRRVFKRRLGQVKLTRMERDVLGMHREHDVSGAEIPAIYWNYVRGADGTLLAPIVEHNANDLVALAALVSVLCDRFDNLGEEHEPADKLGVAQVAARANDVQQAERWAEAAACGGGPDEVTADALWLMAELARKRRDFQSQLALLERALPVARTDKARSRVQLALAKLFEHRVKDYARALSHALQADEDDAARDKRLARIRRRMDKTSKGQSLEPRVDSPLLLAADNPR